MTSFLDNWENSRCWDVQPPKSEGDGEDGASDVHLRRPAASDERLASKSEPLVIGAGALLALLGISVRYINTIQEAQQVVVSLVEVVNHFGLDVETAKLTPYAHLGQAGLNPHLSRPRLVQLYPGGPEVFVFDLFVVPLVILRPLLEEHFVGHNSIFDMAHLVHAGLEPGRIECTMLQANALTGKRPSLAALVETELGWRISKEQQVSDWSAHVLSQEQIEYAALDAVLVHRLFPLLDGKIRRKGRLRCYELMRDAQHPIARMQLNGCFFDQVAHQGLMRTWVADRERVHQELKTLLGADFNLGSHVQLAAWIQKNVDVSLLNTWPRGAKAKPKTGAKVLALYPELPFVKTLMQWKILNKKLTSFGNRYSAHINPATGRIHASFIIGGTDTGRLACRNPNIQNPPKESDFRALFAASDGRVMVVADYSQIELRVMALVAQEKTMLAAYRQGIDLHRKTAAALTGVPLEAVTKAQRQLAKAVNFGLLFGQGAAGLAKYAKTQYGVDMSLKQAERYRQAFFDTYPGLRRWQRRTAELAEASHSVRTPSGRVRTFKRKRGKSYFTAFLNTPVQGGAAEVMLAALAALDRRLKGLDAKLVNVVHDEIVLEVAADQAAAAKTAVEEAMVEGMLSVFPRADCNGLVEAHSGCNWAEAKG
jgi:DNA polymerase-1